MANTSGSNKKWRFGLTSLGVIVLVAVIVVNILMWQNNQGKRTQIDSLKNEVSQVNQKTQQVPAPATDLDARLAAAKAALAKAQKALPGDVNANDIIGYIIDTADKCQVQAVPVASQAAAPPGSGQSYVAYDFSVTVSGSLENAMAFMNSLQGSEFPTLKITDCNVDKIEGTDFARAESGTQVTLTLSIAVYVASPAGEEATS